LHEILEDTYELMMHPIKIANNRFLTELTAASDLIYCSPNQIKQACIAMLVNASEAVTENGEIIIRTKNLDEENITFEIIDNGQLLQLGSLCLLLVSVSDPNDE